MYSETFHSSGRRPAASIEAIRILDNLTTFRYHSGLISSCHSLLGFWSAVGFGNANEASVKVKEGRDKEGRRMWLPTILLLLCSYRDRWLLCTPVCSVGVEDFARRRGGSQIMHAGWFWRHRKKKVVGGKKGLGEKRIYWISEESWRVSV